MTGESSWELGKLLGISESARCRDRDRLLGGTEGTARQADHCRGVASELGGGPDLDFGERPFFLLMQEGLGGGLLRDKVTNRGGDRVLKRDWSTGTSRWAPICKNGYMLACVCQVLGPEV